MAREVEEIRTKVDSEEIGTKLIKTSTSTVTTCADTKVTSTSIELVGTKLMVASLTRVGTGLAMVKHAICLYGVGTAIAFLFK